MNRRTWFTKLMACAGAALVAAKIVKPKPELPALVGTDFSQYFVGGRMTIEIDAKHFKCANLHAKPLIAKVHLPAEYFL